MPTVYNIIADFGIADTAIGTYSNLKKAYKAIKRIADELGKPFMTYSNFSRLMQNCESQLYRIDNETSPFKVERVVVK